jgi:hypothetical protein
MRATARAPPQRLLMWNQPPEIIGRRHTEYVQFITPYT